MSLLPTHHFDQVWYEQGTELLTVTIVDGPDL